MSSPVFSIVNGTSGSFDWDIYLIFYVSIKGWSKGS